MVVPGSYRRTQDGLPEGRTGRISLSDFFGGQRRALQLERDRGWDAEGVGPALFGQGVEPWPFVQSHVDNVITTVTTVRAPSPGSWRQRLRRGRPLPVPLGRLSRRVRLGQLHPSGRCRGGENDHPPRLLPGRISPSAAATGSTSRSIPIAGGASTTLSAGLKAKVGIGYAKRLIFADPAAGNEVLLKMTTGGAVDQRELDAPIVNMGSARRQGGDRHPAESLAPGWPGRPDDQQMDLRSRPLLHPRHLDGRRRFPLSAQFRRQALHLAREPGDGTGSRTRPRQGWRAAGLEGRSCHGATVAGNMLVVCCTTRTGASESWAFDGSGWWLLLRSTSQTRVWPMHTGGAGNIDLVDLPRRLDRGDLRPLPDGLADGDAAHLSRRPRPT